MHSGRGVGKGLIRASRRMGLLFVMAGALGAQEAPVTVRGGPAAAWPVGSFADYSGPGGGAFATVRWRPGSLPTPIEVSVAYVRQSPVTRTKPWLGSGTPIDITTGSQLLTMTVGPSVAVRAGPARLGAGAGGGVARSSVTSGVGGPGFPDRFVRGTSFDDLTWVASVQASAGIALSRGRGVGLEAVGGWLVTGPVRYVRETNLPAGVISGVYLYPTPGPLSLVRLQLGLVFDMAR